MMDMRWIRITSDLTRLGHEGLFAVTDIGASVGGGFVRLSRGVDMDVALATLHAAGLTAEPCPPPRMQIVSRANLDKLAWLIAQSVEHAREGKGIV